MPRFNDHAMPAYRTTFEIEEERCFDRVFDNFLGKFYDLLTCCCRCVGIGGEATEDVEVSIARELSRYSPPTPVASVLDRQMTYCGPGGGGK